MLLSPHDVTTTESRFATMNELVSVSEPAERYRTTAGQGGDDHLLVLIAAAAC